MTVCIAAQCQDENGPCFVLCTDARIEDEYSGGEVALKIGILPPNWFYLIAGSVARAQEFVAVLSDSTYTRSETEADAIQAFRVAPRLMKQRLVEEYLNTKWGVTLEQFRQSGSDHFPADTYARMHAEIEQIGIGCEVVIAGFAGRLPMLCLINTAGGVTPHTGFVTAGSGYLLAQASLFRRGYHWSMPIHMAMYAVNGVRLKVEQNQLVAVVE